MPSYAYRAVHASGRISKGEMTAANENELAYHLSSSGMELIEAREKKENTSRFSLLSRPVSPRIIAGFCGRMRDLLQSGLIFPEALRDATETSDNAALRDALTHIGHSLGNGGGIADSFALYPKFFSPVFIAIIGAGEKSGDMAVIFDFLAHYSDNRARTQEGLHRALRYPLFLFLVAGSAVSFMLTTVVPQIVQFLNGLQTQLPLATRLLISVSSVLSANGFSILISLAAIIGLLFMGRFFSQSFAARIDGWILRIPFIGPVILKSALARFTHSFAILFRSGCDVPSCLRQSRGSLGNRALQNEMLLVEENVQLGAALSQAFERIMPGFALGLLRIGERSGNLGKCLDDIATAYDREAQAATDSFIGILEPSLTLAIGGVLAWTVVAVLGPLYGSLSVLGGRM